MGEWSPSTQLITHSTIRYLATHISAMIKYLPLIWILLLGLITTKLAEPMSVQPADHEGFSAIRAMDHINVMAKEIHHMGTQENRSVKNYILDEFEKLDIPTEIFVGHAKHSWSSGYIRVGRTENIIATIKGTTAGKAVMVVGHYDSVLGSPGAADDIHSVACMIEIAKTLRKEEHDNDIIFLITDGEERGLFGAKAFVEQRDVSHIGVLLNYEARGNSGASISFEWSEGNAWLVSQLKKAATKPVANSMSFEIYKNLPNDTDFSFFKEAGINGINHAFIDGFSYYHNPADTPENIDQRSVQHTGTNMLDLTRHFANTDLSNTLSYNASFFNFLGFLIVYPSSWDLILLIATLAFVAFLLFRSFQKNIISAKSFGLSFLLIVLSVILSAALSFGLGKLLFSIYPQYESFYAGQFYNHKWYLVTCIGITIVTTTLLLSRPVLKSSANSFRAAMLLFLGALCVTFYIFIPTAAYFLIYPTIALLLYYYCITSQSDNNKTWLSYVSPYVASIVPLVMWLPVITLFFLAFSLVGLPMPTIHVAIITLSIMILFTELWIDSIMMNYIGLAMIVISLIGGHLNSTPTAEKPLPSNLFYNYNSITDEAHLASSDKHINIGNEIYLDSADRSQLQVPHRRTYWNVATDIKPSVAMPQVEIDTLQSDIARIINSDEVFNTRLHIAKPSNVTALYINGKEIYSDRATDESMIVEAYAMIADTMTIRIEKRDPNNDQVISINSQYHKLPFIDKLPDNALRTDGYTGVTYEIRM